MSKRTLISLLAGMLAICGAAQAADQTLHLRRGDQASIELQENASTGYRWEIDRAASANLSILRIGDRGVSSGAAPGSKPLVGAPGLHRWSIEAVAAGHARIMFAYRRPWEARPVRRHEVSVEIDGAR